jgi:hypothetical protein
MKPSNPERHAVRASRIKPGLVLIGVLIAFAALLAGCGKTVPPPNDTSSENPPVSYLENGLSTDQNKIVEELGYPDQFSISFDPSSAKRMETWIYYAKAKSVDFSDGRLLGQGSAEDQSAKYPSTSLHPQDFKSTTTTEQAAQLLGQPVYTQDVEDTLMTGTNTVVVFNSAIMLYRNGQLLSIDTQVKPPQLTAQ